MDEMLTGEDAIELMLEAEKIIEAVREGEIEGEYFEF